MLRLKSNLKLGRSILLFSSLLHYVVCRWVCTCAFVLPVALCSSQALVPCCHCIPPKRYTLISLCFSETLVPCYHCVPPKHWCAATIVFLRNAAPWYNWAPPKHWYPAVIVFLRNIGTLLSLCSSKTLVASYQAARCHNPGDQNMDWYVLSLHLLSEIKFAAQHLVCTSDGPGKCNEIY
jgi:hypothetical protein